MNRHQVWESGATPPSPLSATPATPEEISNLHGVTHSTSLYNYMYRGCYTAYG